MSIRIEFYGIPRQRAGLSTVQIDTDRDGLTLVELLKRLAQRCPELESECIEEGRMKRGFVVNLDGQQFVSDSGLVIAPGQSVLIMSADAGG